MREKKFFFNKKVIYIDFMAENRIIERPEKKEKEREKERKKRKSN